MNMTLNYPDRIRDQEAQHVRHNDIQKLDALLRIEELLQKLVRAKGLEDLAHNDAPELTMSQFVTKEDLQAAKDKAEAEVRHPTKKKNPRQL
jgi:hypothetical protein